MLCSTWPNLLIMAQQLVMLFLIIYGLNGLIRLFFLDVLFQSPRFD